MRTSTRAIRLFGFLLLLGHEWAGGQTITGRISGRVQDASGAVVGGASVAILNNGTQISVRAATDERGDYVVQNLAPGNYTVTAEHPGFKTESLKGLELSADARLTANFTLPVGETAERVEVIATGEQVNVVSGELSHTIDAKQVDQLALNGRNYMQLVSLIPGSVLLTTDQMALTTSLSTTGQAINGQRSNTSNLTVDGSYNLDAGSNGSQINAIGLDFIQEVKTQTSNFSAEYGRQSGASINVITKSGSNQFHGGVFEFLRNDAFDARSFFAPSNPPLRFNDFGWNVGGPIKKSKLFFFGGQEWKRIRQYTSPALRTLPTTAQLAGDFSATTGTLNYPGTTTPIPNRNIASLITADGRAIGNVYRRMQSLASSFTDRPVGNNATYQLSNPFNSREDLVRVDYTMSDKQFVYLRYIHDNFNIFDPFGSLIVSQLPTTPNNRQRPGTSWQIAHTWTITPSLINEAKVNAGWQGQRVLETGDNWTRQPYGFTFPLLYPSPQGVYPSGIPGATITGYASFLGPTFYVSTSTDASVSDSVSWIKGANTLKAGVLITRNRKDANGRPPLTGSATFNASGNPNTTGNALADALLGNFRTFSESQYDPVGFFRFSQYDAFVTDQWKVTRNLSLEAGLRFQAMPPAYTKANNITNFLPSAYIPSRAVSITRQGVLVPNSGNPYDGLVRAGSGIPADQAGRVADANSPSVLSVPTGAPLGLYHAAYPVAPRVSFAYSPGSSGKTSIRGGFGMFYDRIDETAIVQALTNPPFAQTIQLENGNIANPSSGNTAAASVLGTVRAVDPNLKTPYVMNYSLSVQREVPAGLFLELAYAGNQSRHLNRAPDINMPSFALLSANAQLPTAQQAATNYLRPYQGYSQILQRLSDANSNYNALQIYVTKRKGWLTATASYTFSKALADASSQTETSLNPDNRHFNYGPATFDRRNIFAGTFTAALPRFTSQPKWEQWSIGGWYLSGILHLQSGAPYTITSSTAIGSYRSDYIGGNTAVDSPTPSHMFNTAAFAAPPLSRYGTSGVSNVLGPALETFDFSLAKKFQLWERVSMRLQLDSFNTFNHPYFTTLSTETTSLSFGSATAAGPGRQIQLGVKVNF